MDRMDAAARLFICRSRLIGSNTNTDTAMMTPSREAYGESRPSAAPSTAV